MIFEAETSPSRSTEPCAISAGSKSALIGDVVQVADVVEQLGRDRLEADDALVDPQRLLDPVIAAPVVGRDVSLAAVDVRVEVSEGSGDRLDSLERRPGRRVDPLRLLDLPRLDRGDELLGAGDERGRVALDELVVFAFGRLESGRVGRRRPRRRRRCLRGLLVGAAASRDRDQDPAGSDRCKAPASVVVVQVSASRPVN